MREIFVRAAASRDPEVAIINGSQGMERGAAVGEGRSQSPHEDSRIVEFHYRWAVRFRSGQNRPQATLVREDLLLVRTSASSLKVESTENLRSQSVDGVPL